jgi:hypothetical protein
VRTYDIAVIGTDFGALAAAALLSMKGHKSFMSTPRPSLADALGRTEQEGFSFSRGPALSYGFEPGGEFHRLLGELNITDINPLPAEGYQVALPDRRINVSAQLDTTLEEIRREFPREISKAEDFYRDIKEEAVRVSKSRIAYHISRFKFARSFIAKYQFSNEFLSFLDVQSFFFYQKPVADLEIKDFLTLFTHRPFRSNDSYEKIADRMASTIVRQGGAIQYNEPSTEVVFRENRAIGIRTVHDTIEATTVLLDKSERSRPILFLGIYDQVVPVGMGRDVLYLPDYSQPQNYLSLSLSDREDSAAAPKGMRTLTATFSASMNTLPGGQDVLIGSLAVLVPFLKDFITFTFIPKPTINPSVPIGISFKQLRSGGDKPLLFKGSKRHIYALCEEQDVPQNMVPSIRRLIKNVG